MSGSKLISMRWDADKLAALQRLDNPKALASVVARATKYGGRGAAVEASKLVRARFMKVSADEVKRHIKTAHIPRGLDSFSTITVDPSHRWPMLNWQSGTFNRRRPPKGGMAFRMIKGGKRFRIPGAFPATLKGHEGAYKRKGGPRFPVRHLYTTAPLRYLRRKTIVAKVLERGHEQMAKEFDRYSKYVLSGGKGGVAVV